MKINRTKNATKGIIAGVSLKLYQTLLPFVMRTLMIYYMGMKYLGLNSLFTSILQVLNLAELGVGSAMVFSMYKPIAEDDSKMICALMNLYRKAYRIIGLIIGGVGLALTPFVPHLIKDARTLPNELNIYILYLLNLMATVLTYWLFAYKNCLLQAHQRTDVGTIITIVTNTIQFAFQIFIVIVLKDYYLYVIAMLLSQVINNILTAIIVGKMYPNYRPAGQLEKEYVNKIFARIRDLFTAKLGSVILSSADTIVISSFLGLELLGIYQNYYFVMISIINIIGVIFSSILAGIGNSFITETKEKNFADFKKFSFMLLWLVSVCTACFLCLYGPLMDIWVGKNRQLEFGCVICFCIYFYVLELNRMINVYKDAAGLWHEDRFRPLMTATVNLVVNLLLVNVWGVYGVLLSTVISMLFVGIPWLLKNIFTNMFDRKNLLSYLKLVVVCTLACGLACVASYEVCSLISLNKWMTLFVNLAVCLVVSNSILFILFFRTRYFYDSVVMVDKITGNKLKLKNKFGRLYRP